MAQSIWQRVGGGENLLEWAGEPWRVVEAQHRISTRKLVDSDEEQGLLEGLLDGVKPPVPADPGFAKLHYLLATPFRHPPLRHGSRFGSWTERSLFYGSERPETAFAEVAYYRLLFLADSEAALAPLMVELTAFRAVVASERGIDLTTGAFEGFRGSLVSRSSYRVTQALGREMREDGVELFRYESARDPERGANVGIFAPGVFQRNRPRGPRTWYCVADEEAVEFSRKNYFKHGVHRFERGVFLVRGRLPKVGS
ncbi:MAG: RES family NAD+ phosphorylase [bacterium]